jgi:hypothetical protein
MGIMSLQDILLSISKTLERERIRYAIIGAFALAGYGYVRATRDIDILLDVDNGDRVVSYLESLGFETLHRTSAFSNHLHPVGSTRLDLMFVEGETAQEIFSAVRPLLVLRGAALPVVAPQHLMAMKLFAAKHDPARKLKELGDIKELVDRTGMDRATIESCFATYGMDRYLNDIVDSENSDGRS